MYGAEAHIADNTEQAFCFFHQGMNSGAYRDLGVHCQEQDGGHIYTFRTYAPHADRVFAVGDFNGWQESHEMQRVTDGGIFAREICVPYSLEGGFYKFRIHSGGRVFDKADPYAFACEGQGKTASVIYTKSDYVWRDIDWLRKHQRKDTVPCDAPIHIYEVHLASFLTRDSHENRDGNACVNYKELADEIIPYVLQMGYTHIELMPIAEYLCEDSWGYHVCNCYAPTRRFGTADDLKCFIDQCHLHGLYVILDWVPTCFPKDAHALYEFDGAPLYEYQDREGSENRETDICLFDLGRKEVQCFLISNALFWMREYHIDGLSVSGVASLIDREISNGKKESYTADFLRKLNLAVYAEFPFALMIADGQDADGILAGPLSDGGVGFGLVRNTAWAGEMGAYLQTDPIQRQYCHEKMSSSLLACDEKYLLPLSHDEVVHGKRSLLDKCFGNYEEKFATARTFFAYMIAHPGKKMTFMGCEFGSFREWDFCAELEWSLCKYPYHSRLRHCLAYLNRLYLSEPCLYEEARTQNIRICADAREDNVVAFARKDLAGNEVVAIFNFAGCLYSRYSIPALKPGRYVLLFNTDEVKFGGNGNQILSDQTVTSDGILHITLPPLSAVYLKKV